MIQWRNGQLSEPVKACMTMLVDGMKSGFYSIYSLLIMHVLNVALATDDYVKADQLHVKLMVDHISEVISS